MSRFKQFLQYKLLILLGIVLCGAILAFSIWYNTRSTPAGTSMQAWADDGTPFSQALLDSYDLVDFLGADYVFNNAVIRGDVWIIERYFDSQKDEKQLKTIKKKYLLYRALLFSSPDWSRMLDEDDKKWLQCMRDRFSGSPRPIDSYDIQSELYKKICAWSSDRFSEGESYADVYKVTYTLYKAKTDLSPTTCRSIPWTSDATNYFLCLWLSGKKDWENLSRQYIYARRNDCQFMKSYDTYLMEVCQNTPEIWRHR